MGNRAFSRERLKQFPPRCELRLYKTRKHVDWKGVERRAAQDGRTPCTNSSQVISCWKKKGVGKKEPQIGLLPSLLMKDLVSFILFPQPAKSIWGWQKILQNWNNSKCKTRGNIIMPSCLVANIGYLHRQTVRLIFKIK